jgi:hypothetical protein
MAPMRKAMITGASSSALAGVESWFMVASSEENLGRGEEPWAVAGLVPPEFREPREFWFD